MNTHKQSTTSELIDMLFGMADAYKIALKGADNEASYMLIEVAKRLQVYQEIQIAKEHLH